jgi:hypothetical protein
MKIRTLWTTGRMFVMSVSDKVLRGNTAASSKQVHVQMIEPVLFIICSNRSQLTWIQLFKYHMPLLHCCVVHLRANANKQGWVCSNEMFGNQTKHLFVHSM